jgi:hypothetical protein
MDQKLHFEIAIQASPEKVYQRLIDDQFYRQWTEPFYPGSFYKGSWDKNSRIQFLAVDEDGQLQGMFSRIDENIPNRYISIEHLGIISNGEEVTSGPEVDPWKGAHEIYTLEKADNYTKFIVDVDSIDIMEKFMLETWPKALDRLKEICEH